MPETDEPVIVVDYDPAWPSEFRHWGGEVRRALGPIARRVDHVGSTAVPGLAAKPVIDIQASVASLEPLAALVDPLTLGGWRFHPQNPDRSKRFFLGPVGARRVHLHVRPAGSVDEQLTLLFRDFLRSHPAAQAEYVEAKQRLAVTYRNDRARYVRGKEPVIWKLFQAAHDWSQETGWSPGPSDL